MGKEQRIIELIAKVEDLKADNDDLLETQEQLNETLDEQESEMSDLRKELDDALQSKTSNNNDNDELKATNETLKKEKEALSLKVVHLETNQTENQQKMERM